MGKESFNDLYEIVELIANKDRQTASNTLMHASPKRLEAEAKKVLGLMDAYKEPVLPFANISPEQIENAFSDLKERYGFVIWSNTMAATDEDCARLAQNDPESYLGFSEDDMRLVSIESNDDDYNILAEQLGGIPINGLVITGTVGRWNGTKPAFGVRDLLSGLFDALESGNENVLYVKDGQLQAESAHHDGTNRYVFYTCREGVDPETIVFEDTKGDHPKLESLVPAMAEYFGWDLSDRRHMRRFS